MGPRVTTSLRFWVLRLQKKIFLKLFNFSLRAPQWSLLISLPRLHFPLSGRRLCTRSDARALSWSRSRTTLPAPGSLDRAGAPR